MSVECPNEVISQDPVSLGSWHNGTFNAGTFEKLPGLLVVCTHLKSYEIKENQNTYLAMLETIENYQTLCRLR